MISYQLNFISLNGLIYYFFMEMSLLAWKQSSNSVVGYSIKEKLFIVVTITFFKTLLVFFLYYDDYIFI